MDERNKQLRIAGTGRLMRMKAGGWFWNDEIEERFFDHLAADGNVRAAADAVGFCTPTVYRMRRRRPEFAARWQAALEQGYARLEMALLQAANDSIADRPFDDERPIPRMTVEQAMNVLRAHRHSVSASGRPGPGRIARVRSVDDVRAEIENKVRAIAAADDPGMAIGDEGYCPCRKREGSGEDVFVHDGSEVMGPPPTSPASGREGEPERGE